MTKRTDPTEETPATTGRASDGTGWSGAGDGSTLHRARVGDGRPRRRRRLLAAATTLVLAVLVMAATIGGSGPASAQLEIPSCASNVKRTVCLDDDLSTSLADTRESLHEILHADGRKVGEVYVVRPSHGASEYVEHWVLFPGFEYPDRLRPAAEQSYTSEQDFLDRVPFPPGSRYVRWDVAEQDTIPGRPGTTAAGSADDARTGQTPG